MKKDNYKEIDIHKIIDEVIEKNKGKIEKLHQENINIDHFSLKNKKGDTLYYLRKKSEEKNEKESTEEPIKRKKLKFGRNKKFSAEINLTELKTKDFKVEEKSLPGFKNISKNQDFDDLNDEKIIDQKILENFKNKNSSQKNDDIRQDYTDEIVKNYKIIKNKNLEPKKLNNFLTLLNRYKGKITVTNLVTPQDLKNIQRSNQDINKTGLKQPSITKNKEKSTDDGFNIPEKEITQKPAEKKSFFSLKKKESKKKHANFSGKLVGSKNSLSNPMFKVENIPTLDGIDTDEAGLIDKKIKERSINGIEEKENIGEEKALQLAAKHIKDMKPNEGKKQAKTANSMVDPFVKHSDDSEHEFFDEEGSSASTWSPQLTEKGKRMVPSMIGGQGEIDEEDLKKSGELELPKDVLQPKSVKLTDLGFSEKEWQELDFYSLQEPFAYVEVLQEKESLDKCYFLVEISLSEEEGELLSFIRETMSYQDIDPFELEEKNEDEYLLEQLNEVIKEYNIEITDDSKRKIYYYMRKKSIGLDRIDPFLRDPNIEDISCDGAGIPVFLYHRKFGSLKSNIRFTNEEELSSFVFKLAQKCNKHISIAEPMIDATMPDGSRIQMTLSDEVTKKGSTFTIRKFRADPFSPPDLVEFNTMSSEMIAYMWFAIENGVNTLFAGGTASGKTTALNALSLFIPRESKIVSIEETREINLPHPNWIPGVARSGFGEVVANKMVGEIDMYDLMKAALRQRPEYIIVGEIRGREAYVLFQAMATGHATYSTVHADSAQSLIHRLEGKPINIPRIMLQSMDIVSLHIITRVKNIRARRCKQIIEIIDIDPTTKEILTNEVFRWDPVDDKFKYSGKSYVLERIRAEKDISREEITNEIKNRMRLVEWMNKSNIRGFKEVANIVAHYGEDPKEILKRIK